MRKELRITGIQLAMLVERYRRQAAEPRRTSYSKQVAEETLAALKELGVFRKTATVELKGTVR